MLHNVGSERAHGHDGIWGSVVSMSARTPYTPSSQVLGYKSNLDYFYAQ